MPGAALPSLAKVTLRPLSGRKILWSESECIVSHVRYHYEGWIDGGAEYKHIAPLATNRAKKRSQRKYCWSRGLRINHLHGSVSLLAVVKQLSEGCPFDAITIPCLTFEWVSANDAHGMLTKH